MLKTTLATCLFLLTNLTPAIADSNNIARILGNVIASEEYCGLTYEQEAIQRYIHKNVRADDMGFPGSLNMMISGSSYSIKQLSKSAKTAHCAQISRIAKSYQFIK